VLRNAIGKTIKGTTFVKEVENGMSKIICDVFDEIYDKAKDVLDKVQTATPAEK
jgi:hypothetical protein